MVSPSRFASLLLSSALVACVAPKHVTARPEGYADGVAVTPRRVADGLEVGDCLVGVGIPAGRRRASQFLTDDCERDAVAAASWVRAARWAPSPEPRWLLVRFEETRMALFGPPFLTPWADRPPELEPPLADAAGPLWPAGYAGPPATCAFGAVVEEGVVIGLRAQPDCPAELVSAAADRVRGHPWTAVRKAGVDFWAAGYTWDQAFEPSGAPSAIRTAYGWRPGVRPTSAAVEPVSTSAVRASERCLAAVTVGADGVPRGVAVDCTPRLPSSGGSRVRLSVYAVRTTEKGDERGVTVAGGDARDPARDLLQWRWPTAGAPYRVLVEVNSSGARVVPGGAAEGGEGVPVDAPELSLAEFHRPSVWRAALPSVIEVPRTGPLRIYRPEGTAADVPQWAIRADRGASWDRVAQGLSGLVPAGGSARVAFVVQSSVDGVASEHAFGVSLTTGPEARVVRWVDGQALLDGAPIPTVPVAGRLSDAGPAFVRPTGAQTWGDVVTALEALEALGVPLFLAPVVEELPPGAPAPNSTRTVHWSELKLRKQVTPDYPAAMKKQGVEGRCSVWVVVGRDGTPWEVTPKECEEPWFSAVVPAAMATRWYPYDGDPSAQTLRFAMNYVFRVK